MKHVVYMWFFLLATCFVVAARAHAAQAHESHLVFSFELGGGLPGETRYTVKVFDNGTFSASSEGMPIIKGGHLTKQDYSTDIPQSEVAHIVALAAGAREFVNNPAESWPDCRAAEIVVIIGKNRRTRISRRSGCIGEQWSQQPQVASLLRVLEKYLPKYMKGWP